MSRKSNRFLCPVCLDLKDLKGTSEQTPGIIVLACGHERPYALLPSNGVSVEHLDSPLGKSLFPVSVLVSDAVTTHVDADVAIAEGIDEDDEEEEAA